MSAGRPPTVLRVIARLNVGGPAIHVTLLDRGLAAKGWRGVLVAGRVAEGEGDLTPWSRERGADPVELPTLSRAIAPLADLRALWSLVRLIRRHRPTVLHTHTAKAGTLGRLAALLTRVPVVVHTFHGHTFHGYFGPRKTAVFLAIERLLARYTDAIIGVSRRVCDDLRALRVGRPSQLRHVPLGLELERFRDVERHRGALRRDLGVAPDAPLVGIVARLVPIKRHDVFLDAAARVVRQVPAARFAIVGDGELRASLEARVRELGLTDAVRFAGWRDDLERVLADLDVVALTSDNEGLPVALIESLAAGRPAVATDVGGVAELIRDGENGYVVPAGDAEALARRMTELLADLPRARRMGAGAQRRALADYAASRLVDDIDALYRELLARRRRGRPGRRA